MNIPFLHNVRRGLATNSSSSHSLVFHAAPVADTDLSSAAWTDTEFGWDHFILDSLGSKLMYALTQAIGRGWWGENEDRRKALEEAKEKWGHLFPELADQDALWVNAMEGYVDHQSYVEVNDDFLSKVRDPRVVIHGGNDNGGYPYGYDDDDEYNLPEGMTREMLG